MSRFPDDREAALETRVNRIVDTTERLRSEGVAGQAILWIHVSEQGEVLESRIAEESQHPAFNQAAREVVGTMKFKPATYEGEKTAVWLQQRVAIRAR